MRSIRIVIAIVAALAVLGIGAFFYLTRDLAAPSATVAAAVEVSPAASSTTTVYTLSQEASQAEYNIYELLNGQDKTVVGTTDQVAGEIALNLADLSQSQIGELRINARTFATDNDRRDNAVARFVLQSETDANEFIVFQPTAITGLSGSASVGDSVTFQVMGDLTVAGVTQSVTFDVTATVQSDTQIAGTAQTVISRAAFNLSIPEVPSVANVGDDVTLKLAFVADAA
jgi:polyisoprenoid-binding protein YceI